MSKLRLMGALSLLLPVFSLASPLDVEPARPEARNEQPFLANKAQNGPDERILWRLYHAGKIEELRRQIDHLKALFPYWQVPPDLIEGLRSQRRPVEQQPGQQSAPRQQRSFRVTKTERGLCPDKFANWRRAETYIKRNQTDKALELYRHMISRCRSQQDKVQTLETAGLVLDYHEFARLLELTKPDLPLMVLDRLLLASLKSTYLNRRALSPAEQAFFVSEMTPLLFLAKDGDFAEIIAWRYYDEQNYPEAIYWFELAQTWNNRSQNAKYGLLLSLERIGHYDRILTIVAETEKPSAEMQSLAARIYKVKAWRSLENNDLISATDNIRRAKDRLGADAESKELEAWIAEKAGRHHDAAELFDELYRQSPARKYAQAYVRNQAEVDRQFLARKALSSGGLLWDEYNSHHAQELYFRKQFRSAYRLSPSADSRLHNIDSPEADLGVFARFKKGEDGLDRLDIFRMPIAGFSYTLLGDQTIKLGLSRVQLYAGRPVPCQSSVGILPEDSSAKIACRALDDILAGTKWCANFFSPTQDLDHGLEIDFSYRKDGWFSPFIKLGTTPIGGVIDPTVTFDLGFDQQTGYGHWRLEAYSQPIRQSLLSYTGIRDPYRGVLSFIREAIAGSQHPYQETITSHLESVLSDSEWGRVLSTGFKSSIFFRINNAWNVSGAVDFAWVHGKNVADNSAISVSASVGRSFDVKGFEYLSVGPSINYQHFDKNLSHFTLGHGGYFSPEHYYNIGAGVNFLTEEGLAYVIKGRVTAGFQGIKEAASPWFPLLKPDAGRYGASHSSGEALDIELKGVWLVTPNIQLGGGAAVRKTSGFEDYTGGLFIRYFFASRKASFSTDIPDGLFASMY